MSYFKNVLRAVDFIERNLCSPISIADVASEAAYSTFHFVRLFRAVTGDTPGSYLRRRRLTEAAKELVRGRRRIIEIAFDYQFQSQEAFTRAFRDCFGTSPLVFRKRGSARVVGTRRIDRSLLIHYGEGVSMEPRIVKKGGVKLIGLVCHGDNRNWEIAKLWEEFMPMMGRVPNALPAQEAYGVCFYTESFAKTGLFYYMAGLPVLSLEEIPVEFVGKTLPTSEYAVFTHKGPLTGEGNTIRDTYAFAYGTWLPKSEYVSAYPFDFEFYDARYKGNDNPASEIEVWIPIRKN